MSGIILPFPAMYDTPRPRCGDIGLVRLETVVRGGVVYQHFYCKRCDYSWRSPGVPSIAAETVDLADDKPEPSRATISDGK